MKREIGRLYCCRIPLSHSLTHPMKPIDVEDATRLCGCRCQIAGAHWHPIYDIDGKSKVDWDVMIDAPCYNCGTTESENWYSPHWIASRMGFHYCESCFRRLYHKGDYFCGLRKDKEVS